MARKLLIRDVTLRDGQQSLFATRMQQAQIDRVLPIYKEANYHTATRLQAVQKGLAARHVRIEQRSVLLTYVSSESRSATSQMSLFQKPATFL